MLHKHSVRLRRSQGGASKFSWRESFERLKENQICSFWSGLYRITGGCTWLPVLMCCLSDPKSRYGFPLWGFFPFVEKQRWTRRPQSQSSLSFGRKNCLLPWSGTNPFEKKEGKKDIVCLEKVILRNFLLNSTFLSLWEKENKGRYGSSWSFWM